MLKRIALAVGVGLGAYVVYRGFLSRNYTTANGEGDGLNAVAGDFMNVGLQAVGMFSEGEMRVSFAGLNHLKTVEALRLQVYDDATGRPLARGQKPQGFATIGYGHKLLPGEDYFIITEAQAMQILARDLIPAENAVNRLVKVPITQKQFDALVSFVFNAGAGAFARSTLLRELNSGNYLAAQQNFTRWIYSTINGVKTVVPGLANRRLAESRLFAEGSLA